ncbi:carbon-nitrogen hydrolase family protein [Roseateles paludis]|uniref:Carbon-nitrogen hydrolase family protein n=1 Tax=Roseateles paludis TaxID=3145238 RepID=A0ABV0FWH2_9BURK
MKVAALQMVSGPDVAANLSAARRLLEQAAAQGARLAALPEYFCLIGQHDRDKLAIAEDLGSGPMQQMLADAARELGLYVVGGTLPLKADTPDRVRNSTLVFDPQGQRIARYDKIHLFAFDNGRESYDEGRVLEAGSEPTSFEVDGLRVGLSVCYDLRFPELFRRYAPVDLLLVPAAFTHTTGQAHWELLLRARAVENQCYVLAPAQGGTHPNGRRTFGHTELIDPWGQVLAVQAEGEGVVIGEVDLARIAQVREQLPALKHRKL